MSSSKTMAAKANPLYPLISSQSLIEYIVCYESRIVRHLLKASIGKIEAQTKHKKGNPEETGIM